MYQSHKQAMYQTHDKFEARYIVFSYKLMAGMYQHYTLLCLEEIVSFILLCSNLDSQCQSLDSLRKGRAISQVLSAPAIAAHISATEAIIVKAINQFLVCDHPIIKDAGSDEILRRPCHRTHLYKKLFEGELKVCSPLHLLGPALITG